MALSGLSSFAVDTWYLYYLSWDVLSEYLFAVLMIHLDSWIYMFRVSTFICLNALTYLLPVGVARGEAESAEAESAQAVELGGGETGGGRGGSTRVSE